MLLGNFKFIIFNESNALKTLLMYVHAVYPVDFNKVLFDLSYLSPEVQLIEIFPSPLFHY